MEAWIRYRERRLRSPILALQKCHQKKATVTHMYDAASTSQAIRHIEDIYSINRGGPISPQRKKQRTLFDMADLDSHRPKDQARKQCYY